MHTSWTHLMLTAQLDSDEPSVPVPVPNEKELRGKQISSATPLDAENGCDNTRLPEALNPPPTVTLRSQKKRARMAASSESNEPTFSLTLAARLEAIEAQLQQITALRAETLSKLSGVADEIVSTLPVLLQSDTHPAAPSTGIASSGLARILDRFNQLRRDFEQRRRVSQQRLAYQQDCCQKSFASQVQAAQEEAEDDQAETIVAIVHKQRSAVSGIVSTLSPSSLSSVRPSLRSSTEDSSLAPSSKPPLLATRRKGISAASSSSMSGAVQRQGSTPLRHQTPSAAPLRPLKMSVFEEDMALIKAQLK